jgi:hypothetical protein
MRDGAERAMIRLVAVLALGACTVTAGAPGIEREAVVTWRENHPDFGGFSAVEVLDEGSRFVAVTDRGYWATGEMQREDGRLVGIVMTGIGPLLGVRGAPLTGRDADAEAIARGPDGAFYLAFEAHHRIRRYPEIGGPAEHVEGHPDFPRLQTNSGLEALAIDAQGTIYAIPERSGALDRPFPVFRKRDGRGTGSFRWSARASSSSQAPISAPTAGSTSSSGSSRCSASARASGGSRSGRTASTRARRSSRPLDGARQHGGHLGLGGRGGRRADHAAVRRQLLPAAADDLRGIRRPGLHD